MRRDCWFGIDCCCWSGWKNTVVGKSRGDNIDVVVVIIVIVIVIIISVVQGKVLIRVLITIIIMVIVIIIVITGTVALIVVCERDRMRRKGVIVGGGWRSYNRVECMYGWELP